MRAVRLIGAATPRNANAELDRLEACFTAGKAELPRWVYEQRDVKDVLLQLGALGRRVRARATPALASLYSARIVELELEAAMVGRVGRVGFGDLAKKRFSATPSARREADAVAARWAKATAEDDEGERIASDASDPRSLVSQVRAAIGAHRAPFAVRTVDALGALAATGERTVYVARGRALSERAARRVALHEVLGHVLPRVRAERAHPIFSLGTARGTDDQEGLALLYEEREGLLDARRRVELARRHVAAAAMRRGADFVEVVRALVRAHDTPLRDALLAASRAFRGSDGRAPGLGRESVYIASFLRVRAHVARRPEDERTLASGQVAVSTLRALERALGAQFAGKHASPVPPPATATV